MHPNPKIASASVAALTLCAVVGATELSHGRAADLRAVEAAATGARRQAASLPGLDALRGDGIYLFYGARVGTCARQTSRRGDSPRADGNNQRRKGWRRSTATSTPAISCCNGERRRVGRPNFATPAQDGTITLTYPGRTRCTCSHAAGLRRQLASTCSHSCARRENYSKQEAARQAVPTFPAGIGRLPGVARFIDDALMLPERESFTGAKNTGEFVHNFSKQIPFCLAYEDRKGAKPYAMLFKTTGAQEGRSRASTAPSRHAVLRPRRPAGRCRGRVGRANGRRHARRSSCPSQPMSIRSTPA